MRDGFAKAWRKRQDYFKGSGHPGGHVPTCQHFELLLFMKDSVANKPNKSSNIASRARNIPTQPTSSQPTQNLNDSASPTFDFHTSAASQSSSNPNINQSFGFLSPPAGLPAAASTPSRVSITRGRDKTSASSNNFTKPGPKERAGEKRKAEERRDGIDALLVKTLASESSKENLPPAREDSGDMLFCKSLAPILEKLPRKKNRRARIKIQEVLYELEESDSD